MGTSTKINLFRLPGWEERLDRYLTSVNKKTFDRGDFDCLRFTSDAVFEIVGMDLADEYRHRYKNDVEAKKIIEEAGPDGFYTLVNQACLDVGFQVVDWKRAQRGDPVFIISNEADPWAGGVGVCAGAHALSPSKKGLNQVPMRFTRTVWHIPYPHG